MIKKLKYSVHCPVKQIKMGILQRMINMVLKLVIIIQTDIEMHFFQILIYIQRLHFSSLNS